MRSNVHRVSIAVLLFIALLLPSCKQNDTPQKDRVVHFGSFSVAVDYGPYLVAKNKGWFGEALKPDGYSVEYTLFQSLPTINESLATGRVDVVFEAAPPAIVGRAAGIGLQITGISCTLVQEILVPTASSVQSPADLKGAKIAVLAGTSSHYGLLRILGQSGLTPDDIEVVDMVPPDAKNAFETGQVDGWAVWPPWVEQEEIAGLGRVLSGGDAKIHSIMAVRTGFAKEHPAAVGKVVATLQRAKRWIRENPGSAQQIVSKELDVPLDVVKRSWPRHDWAAVIDDAVIEDIEAKAEFLHKQGFIKKAVNVRGELIDTVHRNP